MSFCFGSRVASNDRLILVVSGFPRFNDSPNPALPVQTGGVVGAGGHGQAGCCALADRPATNMAPARMTIIAGRRLNGAADTSTRPGIALLENRLYLKIRPTPNNSRNAPSKPKLPPINTGPTSVSATIPTPSCELMSAFSWVLKAEPFWNHALANTGPPRKSGRRVTRWAAPSVRTA